MQEFVVWGGRGHAKVIRDLLALNEKRVVAIVDNDHGLPSPFSDVNIFMEKMVLELSLNQEKVPSEQKYRWVVLSLLVK